MKKPLALIRSSLLPLYVLLLAAAAAPFIHCSSTSDRDADASDDAAITGVNNAMGLGVRYDERTGTIQATLKTDLADDEQLYVRLRRGAITLNSQKQLDCNELAESAALTPKGRDAIGKAVFQGPAVDKSLIDLLHLFDDPGWANSTVPQTLQDEVRQKGPTAIVEACVLKGGVLRAKLQTSLAYAWDQNTKDERAGAHVQSLRIRANGDEPDGGQTAASPPGITEENVTSQLEYGKLCVQELGEIPFFKKRGEWSYDTFDCRNLVGTNADGATGPIDGVEGARIPVTVDGVVQENCSPGHELGLNSSSYGCMEKADHGMYLATGEVQPGPMVVTAKNDKGTHWVLLCRKVADDGKGMMKTTVFNDMAMIGHNPKTGRTCFFQNSIGSGRDGAHVPHPADEQKSISVWSDGVQAYCSGSCHAESPFVHSPWIDGAKRSNGATIVPKAGELPDFPISRLDTPYNIVAADARGFSIPKQLVSDEVGPCNNCHRLAGNTMGTFARWSTGTGEEYFRNITDTGKKFAESHWMPPRLSGITEASWPTSKFAKALELIDKCNSDSTNAACEWADVPRGAYDNPRLR